MICQKCQNTTPSVEIRLKKLVHREKALKNNRTDLKGYKNDSIFDLREGNWQTHGTLFDVPVGGGMKAQ